ncbi:MAG: hypothetical protein Q8N69_03325 [bacterium]|nr:hypothetical protein [bacterium]
MGEREERKKLVVVFEGQGVRSSWNEKEENWYFGKKIGLFKVWH